MLTENGTYAVSCDARVPAWGFCVSIFLNPQGECRNVLSDGGWENTEICCLIVNEL